MGHADWTALKTRMLLFWELLDQGTSAVNGSCACGAQLLPLRFECASEHTLLPASRIRPGLLGVTDSGIVKIVRSSMFSL